MMGIIIPARPAAILVMFWGGVGGYRERLAQHFEFI